MCQWGLGNVSGGGGGLGLCGDDGGHEHYSKGLYDNNEQKKFTNAKYNSPFLFLHLNSQTKWLTRWLLKSYKQGWHRLRVEEWEPAMRGMHKRCRMCKRCRMHKRCRTHERRRMHERCRMHGRHRTNRWMRRGDAVHVMVYPPVLHVPPNPRSHLQRPNPFPTLSDRPPTPLGRRSASHSLSWTLVCFYYSSLLDTLNSP